MEVFSQEALNFIEAHTLFFVVFFIWSLIWKGLALWKSARLSHRWWFAIILVANTLGILDIIYLYFIARKFKVETKEDN